MDEVRHFLSFAPKHDLAISGAAHYINSGEFFAHPQALEILNYLKKSGFSVRAMGTNGIDLQEPHVRAMSGLVERVALHLCHYERTEDALNLLDRYQIPYEVVIVPYRSALEGGTIEGWVRKLQGHNPSCIRILKPGYTRFSPPQVARQMDISNAEILFLLSRWQKVYSRVLLEYQINNHHLRGTEILISLYHFHNEYQQYTSNRHRKVLFLLAESVQDIFVEIVDRYLSLNDYKAVIVPNRTFGGSCDSAGLLLVDDYIAAVNEIMVTGYRPGVLVLSKASFPVQNVDLKGDSPLKIGDAFDLPIMWC